MPLTIEISDIPESSEVCSTPSIVRIPSISLSNQAPSRDERITSICTQTFRFPKEVKDALFKCFPEEMIKLTPKIEAIKIEETSSQPSFFRRFSTSFSVKETTSPLSTPRISESFIEKERSSLSEGTSNDKLSSPLEDKKLSTPRKVSLNPDFLECTIETNLIVLEILNYHIKPGQLRALSAYEPAHYSATPYNHLLSALHFNIAAFSHTKDTLAFHQRLRLSQEEKDDIQDDIDIKNRALLEKNKQLFQKLIFKNVSCVTDNLNEKIPSSLREALKQKSGYQDILQRAFEDANIELAAQREKETQVARNKAEEMLRLEKARLEEEARQLLLAKIAEAKRLERERQAEAEKLESEKQAAELQKRERLAEERLRIALSKEKIHRHEIFQQKPKEFKTTPAKQNQAISQAPSKTKWTNSASQTKDKKCSVEVPREKRLHKRITTNGCFRVLPDCLFSNAIPLVNSSALAKDIYLATPSTKPFLPAIRRK